MKKSYLFLIILITFSCDKDLPNQFTSVEGIVTDYYSKKPVPDIPVVVIEAKDLCLIGCENVILDTVFSNSEGIYYFEFYNDSDRHYTVSAIRSENYFQDYKSIVEGKKNTINLSIKPYKTLHLKCYNQSNSFNSLYVYSYLDSYVFSCTQCEELTVVDFKIVPERGHSYHINLNHYNGDNKIDKSKSEYLDFFTGINDTTINYYY
jgi:hypothetical protein